MGLYFLVAQPNPAEDAYIDPNRLQEFAWQSWSKDTFQRAQAEDRLVFLLVTNPPVPAASELQNQIESNVALTTLLANRFVPVQVDRRVRPDIAERYAEGRSFQAMLLLPTGEALMILEDALADWKEEITEADRYWRDHREDIQSRVESFWSEYEESLTRHRVPREPQESDLEIIDRHVRELAESAIENDAMGIWRVDVSEYLMLRSETEPWAESLMQDVLNARRESARRDPQLLDVFPYAELNRLVDQRMQWRSKHPEVGGDGNPIARIDELDPADIMWLNAAAEAVITKLDGKVNDLWPGNWLTPGLALSYSLPHMRNAESTLDGYLTDALEWLETLTSLDSSRGITSGATALADSIWANLWSPDANALRDKPLRDTPVREIEAYPRPQLGRAATLFDVLAEQSGDMKYRHRADSCLAGFAPYVEDAGAAAAYYGIALLKRFHKGS